MLKAVLLDFDGTLVTEDILDVMCDLVGKRAESAVINEAFHRGEKPGLSGLLDRINLLQGLSLSQIHDKLSENSFLMPGARQLCSSLRENNIVTILASGNILPILQFYQQELDLSYIIGVAPVVRDGILQKITLDDMPQKDFKLEESKKILEKVGVQPYEVAAIGDSIADKSMFLFAGTAIAINPKHGIEEYADYTITNLHEAIPILEKQLH